MKEVNNTSQVSDLAANWRRGRTLVSETHPLAGLDNTREMFAPGSRNHAHLTPDKPVTLSPNGNTGTSGK